uniref:Uncharacterized protein n=1 Tax=Lactuca sativa TaxID=4236 RepID=A0A9R1VET4_LACSA|nr:hypothetical protein LSAT_V11C500237350 [Lactuca sativa]
MCRLNTNVTDIRYIVKKFEEYYGGEEVSSSRSNTIHENHTSEACPSKRLRGILRKPMKRDLEGMENEKKGFLYFSCISSGYLERSISIREACQTHRQTLQEGPNKNQGEEVNLTQTNDEEETTLMVAISQEGIPGNISLEEKMCLRVLTSSEVWYLEKGASNHMMGEKSMFHKLDVKVTGRTQLKDGEQKLLNKVYHIHILKNNIISLRYPVEMDDYILRVFHNNNMLYLKSKR